MKYKLFCQFCGTFISEKERHGHLLEHRDKVLQWFGWPKDLPNEEMIKRCDQMLGT